MRLSQVNLSPTKGGLYSETATGLETTRPPESRAQPRHPEEQLSPHRAAEIRVRSVLEEVMGKAAWEPSLAAGQPPVTSSSERISFFRHRRFPERRETRKITPKEFPF